MFIGLVTASRLAKKQLQFDPLHRYKVKKHWGFGRFYPLHYPLHERYINR